MIKRVIVIVILVLNATASIYSQMKINSFISENKLATYSGQKLILLDFWATWCVPCIPATKHLENIQEFNSTKVFMVSITDEPDDLVKKFLLKKPIGLLVATDLDGGLVKKFNITRRPRAIIFNQNGKNLWEGKPSDISNQLIERLHSSVMVKNNKRLTEIFIPFDDKNTKNTDNDDLDSTLYYIEFSSEREPINRLYNGNFLYQGSIKNLISNFLGISENNIDSSEIGDKWVKMRMKEEFYTLMDKGEILDFVLLEAGIAIKKYKKKEDVIELIIEEENMLWDDSQINWGEGTPKFLEGADRLQANNVTLSELAKKLSDIKGKSYVYKGKLKKEFDWDFNYSFDNFMADELRSSFGVSLKENQIKTTHYSIIKE